MLLAKVQHQEKDDGRKPITPGAYLLTHWQPRALPEAASPSSSPAVRSQKRLSTPYNDCFVCLAGGARGGNRAGRSAEDCCYFPYYHDVKAIYAIMRKRDDHSDKGIRRKTNITITMAHNHCLQTMRAVVHTVASSNARPYAADRNKYYYNDIGVVTWLPCARLLRHVVFNTIL